MKSSEPVSSAQVELPEQPRFRHGIHGSGQILTTCDEETGVGAGGGGGGGLKRGGGRDSFVLPSELPSESKRDLILTSSVTLDKEDDGSTRGESRSA